MLFHTTFTPKAGFTHEDQKKTVKLYENYNPPKGFDLKFNCWAPDGRGFMLAEADTAEAMFEGAALWAGVYADYDIVPVIEVEKAVEYMNKAIAIREST